MVSESIASGVARVCFLVVVMSGAGSVFAAPLAGGTLDPLSIPKYVTPLIIPPEMPKSVSDVSLDYQIAVREFKQQILPPGFKPTRVWSYGSADHPGTVEQGGSFNFPALTVEARAYEETRVKWINGLVDSSGRYLPHLLKSAADQTLHWANPAAKGCSDGSNRTDCRGTDPASYEGPVPMVTHVHGAHVGPESDGYPEAWWLPAANNIPAGYARSGTRFDDATGNNPGDLGYALYAYPNDQDEATLWYHDHTLGMTRLNVYAGPAGFWLIRDAAGQESSLDLPRPAPRLGDAPGTRYYEIPLAIQDRSFNKNGELFYPQNRAFFEGRARKDLKIKFAPESDIAPVWNPEAFFNTMVVNGRTWPFLEVDRAQYRFRLLNGCDSRFLNLALRVVNADGSLGAEVPFYQIGSDQGLLDDVVKIETGTYTVYDDETDSITAVSAPHPDQALLMGPAERFDVIVNFSALPEGTRVRMINTAPDAPFGGFPDDAADEDTTGQVMQFVVGNNLGPDFADPTSLALYDSVMLIPDRSRQLTLNEEESNSVCVTTDAATGAIEQLKEVLSGSGFKHACETAGGEPFGPRAALLGTGADESDAQPMEWANPISENPGIGATEIWEVNNLTMDAHPIHVHLVKYQVVGRGADGTQPPEPYERGWKDTVIAYPGEITRFQASFDIPGLYVWHCHILEHEDNEMMRPFCVGDTGTDCHGL